MCVCTVRELRCVCDEGHEVCVCVCARSGSTVVECFLLMNCPAGGICKLYVSWREQNRICG